MLVGPASLLGFIDAAKSSSRMRSSTPPNALQSLTAPRCTTPSSVLSSDTSNALRTMTRGASAPEYPALMLVVPTSTTTDASASM